jgi:hypothetical protein
MGFFVMGFPQFFFTHGSTAVTGRAFIHATGGFRNGLPPRTAYPSLYLCKIKYALTHALFSIAKPT